MYNNKNTTIDYTSRRKTVHVITKLKYLHNNIICKTLRKSGKSDSVTIESPIVTRVGH